MRFKEKLVRFMTGRYGNDQLNNFIMILVLVIIVVNIFVNSLIISFVNLVLCVLSILRTMSRNIYKRRAENERFLRIWKSIKNKFKLIGNKRRDRKTHVYKKCPKCKTMLRLPKQKGKHTVRCPKCYEKFDIKI